MQHAVSIYIPDPLETRVRAIGDFDKFVSSLTIEAPQWFLMENLCMNNGEIWLINLDPAIGTDIQNTRPAVIGCHNTKLQID